MNGKLLATYRSGKMRFLIPPQLDRSVCPADQTEPLNRLADLMGFMAGNASRIGANLLLFEHAQDAIDQITNSKPIDISAHISTIALMHQWQLTAARDSAIYAFNIGTHIRDINRTMKEIQYLNGSHDVEALRKGSKDFRTLFPHWEAMRHLIGHEAEFVGSEQKKEEHGFQGAYSQGEFIMNNSSKKTVTSAQMIGRTLYGSWKGKIIEFHLTRDMCSELEIIIKKIFQSFDNCQKDTAREACFNYNSNNGPKV